MKRIALALALSMFATTAAHAQLGNILRNLDPSKIKKGAKVVTEATRDFTEEEERQIGRVVAARVLNTYPLSKDEKLQRYVTLVGNTVAAYSARPTAAWHFSVLATDTVNAFSTPGNYVFITTGALKQMKSEAELAAVLGHEITHTTQKHILKEIKRANVVNAGVDLAKATSGNQWLNDERANKVGQLAYEKLFTTGLSRGDELEADRIGTQIADAAGYRSSEMITFLEALQALGSRSEMKMLTATHPKPADRIKALQPVVKKDEGVLLAERWEQWMSAAK